ncbi:MAG: hypothetical protein GKC04_03125, partial [Methanomicrobiales archaeon]|nr:hypothetical protein [Methanomicrobiales archaeon]
MRYHGYFLVLVACALLCLPAAAATADSFTIASDTDWLVAGGTAATISVGLNGTQPGISIAKVLFSCQDETYGQVTALSDSVAPYLTTFTSTKSGTAPLQAEIWYYEAGNASVVYTTLNQKIDHTLPYRISSISYPFEMTVNETATIAILMQDRFGNLIENRRELAEGRPADIEKVRFTCSPDDAGFWNGAAFATSIADEVDASGSIDVMFKASQYIGTNTILVEPAVAVPPRWLSIPGIGDADPVAMTVSVQPKVGNPPFSPADGQSRFFLTDILTDGFG